MKSLGPIERNHPIYPKALTIFPEALAFRFKFKHLRVPVQHCAMGKAKLSLKQKAEIAEEVCKPGQTDTKVASKFGVSRATVYSIKQNAASYITAQEKNPTAAATTKQLNRLGKYADIDAELMKWFHEMRRKNVPLSHQVLQEKARELAKKAGNDVFCASNGWLQRWLQRHGLQKRLVSYSFELFSSPVNLLASTLMTS